MTSTRNRPAQREVAGVAALLAVLSLMTPRGTAAQADADEPSDARDLADPFAPPPEAHDTALDLHAGTLAPLAVGAGARVSLPGQIVVGAFFGGVPDAYADVWADAADAYGAGPGVTELVRQFFGGAFVLRVEAGVRPVAGQGLELLAHYTALISEPMLSTASIDELAGQPLPWGGASALRMNGVLHGFGGELGWAIAPFSIAGAGGPVLRLSIGLTYFAAAGVSLQVPEAMRESGDVVAQAETRIASTFTTYGVVPYASVLAGWRID